MTPTTAATPNQATATERTGGTNEPLAWRPLLRLAFRSARRHKARTALVAILIGLPVAVALLAGILVREASTSEGGSVYWAPGTDLVLRQGWGPNGQAIQRAGSSAIDRALEAQDVLRIEHSEALLTTEDDDLPTVVEVLAYDLTHTFAPTNLVLVEGDTPALPDQVAISEAVADQFGLTIGDRLEAPGFESSQKVIGVVHDRQRNDALSIVAFSGAKVSQLTEVHWHLRFPSEPITVESGGFVGQYRTRTGCYFEGSFAAQRAVSQVIPADLQSYGLGNCARTPFANPALVSALVGGAMLCLTGLLASAAFSTGIRRRIHEYGMLSATGAGQTQIRRLALTEAFVLGATGALGGVVTATILWLGVGGRILSSASNRDLTTTLPRWELLSTFVVGVGAALLAAYLPARTVANVPTQTALAGRIPLRSPAKWVAPGALLLSATGLLLLSVAIQANFESGSDRSGVAAAVGAFITLAGAALLAGPAVAIVSRFSSRFKIGWRLVARDAERQRTRTAAAVGALTVMFIIPIAALTTIHMNEIQEDTLTTASNGVRYQYNDGGQVISAEYRTPSGIHLNPYTGQATDTDADSQANLEWFAGLEHPVHFVLWNRLVRETEEETNFFSPDGFYAEDGLGIWNDEVLAALSVDKSTLKFNSLLTVQTDWGQPTFADGRTSLSGWRSMDGSTISVAPVPVSGLGLSTFISPDLAATLDNVAVTYAGMASLESDLSPADITLLERLQKLSYSELAANAGYDVPAFYYYQHYEEPSHGVIRAAVFALAAVASLLIVGVTASLIATEIDRDLAVMVAVGANPRTRRSFLARQAFFLAALAATIAAPFGLITARALTATDVYAPAFHVPWLDLAVLMLGVPAFCSLAIGVLMRSKPVTPLRRID